MNSLHYKVITNNKFIFINDAGWWQKLDAAVKWYMPS